MPFNHATTDEEDKARAGEYAYIDDSGILCRLDIKQANRTTVTKDTKNIIALFQGNGTLDEKFLNDRLKEFERLVDTLI